jgi:NADPH-dependent glutamate synthase beta subunit-like oxidoreductase
VLGINRRPVAIENIEKNIIERGFAEGFKPQILYKELVKNSSYRLRSRRISCSTIK